VTEVNGAAEADSLTDRVWDAVVIGGGPAGATGAGPNAASSPTITRSTSRPSSSFRAPASSPPIFVVTSTRAPLSLSLWTSSRGASSGDRCTAQAPARISPKKATGCQGEFGRRSATFAPPSPAASTAAAKRSAAPPSSA
jgi:hypothetical protein